MTNAISENSKNGLKNLGYVINLSTCKEELQGLLKEGETVTCEEINAAAESPVYLNRHGYAQDKGGVPVTREQARYCRFDTGHKNKNGEELYGLFTSDPKYKKFQGVSWVTLKELQCQIVRSKLCKMGRLCFASQDAMAAFLTDVATNSIHEPWSFANRPSTIDYPILKSFLENTFEKLLLEKEEGTEGKILYSKDGKHILFDTNLLDKYSHGILVAAEVKTMGDGVTLYMNPARVRDTRTLINMGFKKDAKPEPPMFFQKVEEVIFQPDWDIAYDFPKFEHIIDQRRMRFPEDMRNEHSDSLSRKLGEAINFAVAIARRNYKFIVPMWRPQEDKIQLLMPIYLHGTYNSKPDFALILSPDKKNEMYVPETILPLDAVYQNARLIAKPDEAWLNPNTIL